MVRSWPEFHGESLRRGVFPLELPFAWLLDWIYAWATYGAKPESKAEFDQKLFQPPDDGAVSDDDPIWGAQAVMDTFMSAMASAGSRPRG